MIEYYNQLFLEEQEELTAAIKLLQSQTFVLEKKYDRTLNRYQINHAYRVCEKHLDFIKAYFKIADLEVIENRQYGIIGIQSSTLQGEKLSRLTSVFILLLKLLYDEKMRTASNSIHVYVSIQEVVEKIQLFGLWDNRAISPTDLRRTLSTLKKYQVIEILDTLQDLTYDTRLIIYPTIHLLLTPEDVAGILSQYQGRKEEDDDE